MEQVLLDVYNRTETGKGAARRLRREGRIPALAYAEGNQPVHFSVDPILLMKLLRRKGKNTLLTLDFKDEGPKDTTVMLREMQRDPVKRMPMHADFAIVDQNKLVRASIKLNFKGKPVGLTLGGMADVIRRELEVECLPALIPSEIVVDVTHMGLNSVLHVSDVQMPEGVKALVDERFTLVTISSPDGPDEEESADEEAAVAEA